MNLNSLKPTEGSRPNRKRVGRGIASGSGKTCGRGHKGQHSRSGGYHKVGFEGGQMPLQRRLPKLGFRSRKANTSAELRLHELELVEEEIIDIDALKDAKLVPDVTKKVKVILSGSIEKAVKTKGLKFTAGARKAVEAAGGLNRRLMSRAAANVGSLAGLGQVSELRKRLLFVLFALIVYRIGTFIPVPGIDPGAMSRFFEQQSSTILGMFNMFSGGALERLSIFALGIMPYISASIIMQLMSAVVPSLKELKKEGEAGRRKITQYTRYGTLFLATFQAIGVSTALQNQGIALSPGIGFMFTATITLVTGAIFLMWLGEQITEYGIGNGISIIIFAGIVAGLPSAIGGTLDLVSQGALSEGFAMFLFLMAIMVTAFVIFVERAQRRITVNYARRQQGRKMYAAQSSHLPLKLNMSGVIPPIFASSIILFPSTILQWSSSSTGWLNQIATAISPGQPLYVILYALAIIFFCFFYTAIVFDSRETADNLKRGGAFIPGIRPGDQTASYIDKVLTRLTAVGAIYITLVCLLPEFLILKFGVPFYFGGTSLLIIVVVVMDFMAQVQAHLMSHQYEGLMKKANLKGSGRSTR